MRSVFRSDRHSGRTSRPALLRRRRRAATSAVSRSVKVAAPDDRDPHRTEVVRRCRLEEAGRPLLFQRARRRLPFVTNFRLGAAAFERRAAVQPDRFDRGDAGRAAKQFAVKRGPAGELRIARVRQRHAHGDHVRRDRSRDRWPSAPRSCESSGRRRRAARARAPLRRPPVPNACGGRRRRFRAPRP